MNKDIWILCQNGVKKTDYYFPTLESVLSFIDKGTYLGNGFKLESKIMSVFNENAKFIAITAKYQYPAICRTTDLFTQNFEIYKLSEYLLNEPNN